MTINFPSSPSQGDTYVYQSITYTYDGEKWVGSTAGAFNDVVISGNTADVILQGNDSILTDQTFTFNDQGGKLVPYQQGVWIPSCELGTLEYANVNTVWTRVGNLVTLTSQLYSFTATSADTINIIGLPYNVPSGAVAGSCFYQFGKAGYSTVYVSDSNTFAGGIIQLYNTSAGAWDAFKYSNITGNFTIYVQAAYLTDDTTFVPINGATIS